MKVSFSTKSLQDAIREHGLEVGGRVQSVIDSECVRLTDKYVPFRTGTLKRSAELHTVIGSGEVQYNTPYARRQYHENAGLGTNGTAMGGRRGKRWFERSMADNRDEILQTAAREAGARAE